MNDTPPKMTDLAKAAEQRSQLKLVPGDPNTLNALADQIEKIETIGRAMREKIQGEKMALLQEHDRNWTETQHRYARKIHESTAALEAERDILLRQLQLDYFEKTRELDKIALKLD